MNVLYLHQHFATRQGSGGTRSYEFARYLTGQGHRVAMVIANRRGGGLDQHATHVDGIELVRMGGWYSNYMSAPRRTLEFLRFTARASLIRTLPFEPDVVIATSTPLTIGIPGAVLARRFRVPFVFEVRDLWPQAPVELGALRDPVSIAAARRLERWIYRRADRIIALSPGMAEGVRQAGEPDAKIVCIPNASDTELFSPARRDRTLLERWDLEDRFVAIHAGMMGKANGLSYVVEAARELRDMARDDIHLVLVGYGKTREPLEARAVELDLTNITFSDSIPRSELGAVVSSADVAITSFAPLPVLATNSPNKFFDGLAAGIPNVVNSPGWTRDLVEQHEAGMYVDPRRPRELAEALCALRDDPARARRMGRNARQLALETFDRRKLAEQFEAVLASAMRAPARAAVAGEQAG